MTLHPSDAKLQRWIDLLAELLTHRYGLTLEQLLHSLGDDDWAVRHVLQYGPEAEVLAPPRIRQRVKEALEQMLG